MEQIADLYGQAYHNFVDSLHSKATKDTYDFGLRKYMKSKNVDTVEDLLKNADKPKLIESDIIEYIVKLKNPPYSLAHSTRNMYLSALLTFYTMNDVTLNRTKILKYLGESKKAHRDRAYTTEEIQCLLRGSDNRLSAIVLLLASTGCRLGALTSLKYHNLKSIDNELYQITIYENAKEEYYTFCTPECKHVIDQYIGYRERCGEKLKPDTPLFRRLFDRDDSFTVAHPQLLTTDGISTILNSALIKSGIKNVTRQTENSQYMSRLHKDVSMFNGFRKFVNTMFVKAKVNPVVKEMLLGHTTGLDDNYYRPSQDDVLEEYMKAVDLLTINEENRLKKKVVELKQKADMFDSLEEKIERLNKKLGLE